jgi:hypothetical protein
MSKRNFMQIVPPISAMPTICADVDGEAAIDQAPFKTPEFRQAFLREMGALGGQSAEVLGKAR